jgi:cytochrome c5
MQSLFVGIVLVLSGSGVALAEPAVPSGSAVYKKHCSSCHEGGFKGWMTDAPEMGERDEWAKFVVKGAEQMTHNVVTGAKKHEKKGGCKSCTPAAIRAAVDHILKKTP